MTDIISRLFPSGDALWFVKLDAGDIDWGYESWTVPAFLSP